MTELHSGTRQHDLLKEECNQSLMTLFCHPIIQNYCTITILIVWKILMFMAV